MNVETKKRFLRWSLLSGSIILPFVIAEFIAFVLIELNYQYMPPPPAMVTTQKQASPFSIPETLSQNPRFTGNFTTPSSPVGHELSFVVDFYEDSAPGYRIKKNFSGRHQNKDLNENRVIYDVQVTTDSNRRRIARPQDVGRNSSRHLLFLGCSYMFGTASNDWETIPWQVNLVQSTYEAYNGGHPGFGISDILRLSYEPYFAEGMSQKKGALVYNFIPDHLFRMINSTINSPWGKTLASMRETASGEFEYEGKFSDAHPIKTFIFEWASRLHLLRLFNIYLPPLRDSDYKLGARMLAKVRAHYLAKTDPQNIFIVAIYPDAHYSMNIALWREALAEQEIYFIDYSSLPIEKYIDGHARVFYDGHPNPRAHKLYAQVLARDLASFLNKRNAAQ